MGITDDIRQGAGEAHRQMEREQQHAAEQARRAADRARHAAELWPYLDRYRQAIRRQHSPQVISCERRKFFNPGEYKTVNRSAWQIATQYCPKDAAGNTGHYRLWLDDDSSELWWQAPDGLAHRVTLGEANGHLPAESDQALQGTEQELPRTLGALAARNGVDLLAASQ